MESIEINGTEFGTVVVSQQDELTTSPILNNLVERTPALSSGETGGEWLERGDHPLLNDLVLETLLGFVRRSDLIACRVVSKNWELRTVFHMRATFRVTIESGKIARFIELFSANNFGILFAKFEFGEFRATDRDGQQFLQLFGETITEIDFGGGKSEVHIVEDVSELIRSCPNLKILVFPYNFISRSGGVVKLFSDSIPKMAFLKKITFRQHYHQQRLKYCPSAIEELLTAGPNITEIIVSDVKDMTRNGDEASSNISAVLNCIEVLGRESPIESLHLHYAESWHIHHLWRLAEKGNGIKLKSLTLRLNRTAAEFFYTDTIVQIQLVTILKDTLESLHVDVSAESIAMEFPLLPNLKSFTFKASPNSDPVPLDLTKNFPALRTLEIKRGDWKPWSQFFSQFVPCPTVIALNVESGSLEMLAIQDIHRVFPNLMELKLRIDDSVEVLRHIWSHMTGLESMSIAGCICSTEELDSVLTGIPVLTTLPSFRYAINELEGMSVKKRRDRILELTDKLSQFPSIRNLTKLKHLNFSVVGVPRENPNPPWDFSNLTYLTDVTAYLALYSMDHLHHLYLKRCRLTKSCCEIMRKEMGLESWGFKNGTFISNCENVIPPSVNHGRENDHNQL